VAVRSPGLLGVNLILIVQLDPGESCVLQLFVWVKLLAFGPSVAMVLKVTDTLPWFLTVTISGSLEDPTSCSPKLRLRGETPITVPAPETWIPCGLLDALSRIVMRPLVAPISSGSKLT
jgi:hypothetical protein